MGPDHNQPANDVSERRDERSAFPVVARHAAGDVAQRLKLLVIEDNPSDFMLLEGLLAGWPFDLTRARLLSSGLQELAKNPYDLVLLDLSLPDAHGLDTFYQAHCQVPNVPIVVLTGLEDEQIGIAAVQAGAQDYLVKSQVLPGLLGRAIHYAVERHQTDLKVKQLNAALERRILQLASANQELDKLGTALALSCEQAIQASNFKSQFVARITHDIRTPVSAVLAITDLLLQEETRCDSKATQRLIELIKIAAQSQLRHLTEVLDFSKVEAGKVQIENSDFQTLTLIEDVAELFAASAARQGLNLMTFVDPQLQETLIGDPSRLREILVNLTNNAIKFTSRGEIILRAIKEAEDDRNVTVRFMVSDTGVGMDKETLKHLFEPYIKTSRSPKFSGSGLGLSICKRFVDLMGGEIGADSEDGNGSTFWFSVRLHRSTYAAVSAAPAPAPSWPLTGASTSSTTPAPISSTTPAKSSIDAGLNAHVLVVSGSSASGEIMDGYLQASGWCRSVRASSASEAIAVLRKSYEAGDPIRIALVDLEACTPDSFDLSFMIQDHPDLAGTRLIFLTSVDRRHKGEQSWEAGFSAYLTKPLRRQALIDCVKDVMTGPVWSSIAELSDTCKPVGLDSANGSGQRILVVDDSPMTRQVLALQLARLGARVDTAKDGQEAIEAVIHTNYDLILMDCQMPKVDGLEATRVIRDMQSKTRRTPIIAITGGSLAQDEPACREAGMDDYLHKPVSADQLSAAVARWASTSITAADLRRKQQN